MSNKNEHLIKVTPVWSAWVIAPDGRHVPKFVFTDEKVAREWLRAGEKGERGIRNVLFDGGVPVSGTRRRERALPVSERQAQRIRGTRYLLT